MADLIDRISGEAGVKINLHRFIGAERLYAFGEWSRTDVSTQFNLQGAEATQATALADKIDAQPDANSKALYILRVESVMMNLEDLGDTFYHSGSAVNKTKVYEDLLFV
jgi:hypothetical protein